MPPRHGKSALSLSLVPGLVSRPLPSVQSHPGLYESDYAASWGRKVRNTIQEHPGELRVEISGDSSAADRWDTTEGGGMNAVGTQAAVTGRGSQVMIIDDPHKDREQAESPTMREKVWDWWTGTARERLEPMPWAPFGVVIVMATRWHVDDFTGRLVGRKVDAEAGGQRYSPPWVEYRLPALAELEDPLGRQPGEALWPERYPLPSLLPSRRTSALTTGSLSISRRPFAGRGRSSARSTSGRWRCWAKQSPCPFYLLTPVAVPPAIPVDWNP